MASTKQAAQKKLTVLAAAAFVDVEALTQAIEEARLAGVSAMLLHVAASRLSEAQDGLGDQLGSQVPSLEYSAHEPGAPYMLFGIYENAALPTTIERPDDRLAGGFNYEYGVGLSSRRGSGTPTHGWRR